ncbi:MAG: hypothetical protein ACFB8W_22870 [Elainellaceae cyanobacterium]
MRPIYTALIALGTGMVGFLAGGGLGLVQGGLGGTVVGVALGTASGMCTPIEAALEEQILIPAQVEEIAAKVGQNLPCRGEVCPLQYL